jgi:hypothetical protein
MNKKQKELLTKKVIEHIKKYDDSLTVEYIVNEMKDYSKASAEGRVFCVIDSVSKSGMSKTLLFYMMKKEKYSKKYHVRPFYSLMRFCGYKQNQRTGYFRVHGTGLDLVYHTHSELIDTCAYYNIITKDEARLLKREVPPTV